MNQLRGLQFESKAQEGGVDGEVSGRVAGSTPLDVDGNFTYWHLRYCVLMHNVLFFSLGYSE